MGGTFVVERQGRHGHTHTSRRIFHSATFPITLTTLPAEYAVIRDGIDAIGGVDTEIGIKRLDDIEMQLTQAKADLALLAKQKEQRREQRRPLNPSRSRSIQQLQAGAIQTARKVLKCKERNEIQGQLAKGMLNLWRSRPQDQRVRILGKHSQPR